ncbi:MAG TPA: TolC family protein [Spirochaetota bacterium]|nr:TolC family protein [Spirochaetota bacterium]
MNKKIINLFFIFCAALTIFSSDLTGDLVFNLDINKAVELGIKNNVAVVNNKLELNDRILEIATSFNEFVPTGSVGFSLGSGYSDKTQTFSSPSLGMSLNSSLSLTAKSIFNIVQSVNDYNRGKISLLDAKLQLVKNIKKSYYNQVLANEEINLKEIEVENAKFLYEVSRVQLANNVISEIDGLKKEYSYKSLLLGYDEANLNLKKNEEIFKQLIGINDYQKIILTSYLSDINAPDIEKISFDLDENLSVKTLYEDLKKAINNRAAYISQFVPTLNLGYSFSGSGDLQGGDFDTSHSLRFSLGLQLDNLSPFSRLQTNIIKEQNNIKRIENNIKNQKETKILELKNILITLKELQKKSNIQKLNVELAEKTYNMTLRLYNSGNSNYNDLQEAKKNDFDSKLKLLNVKYEYLSNMFDLEYVLNKELIK